MAELGRQDDAPPGVAAALQAVHRRMAEACAAAGRDPAAVTLIAVSKGQADDRVMAAIDAGHRIFGENYVQEAQRHWQALRATMPDLELHMIGALQSNKAAEAVALFDVIQSVDRTKLATVIARECNRQGVQRRIYLQVNTGEEPQKAGVLPDDTDALVRLCREELGMTVEGLMAIPPADEPLGLHAALLGTIATRNGLSRLSIGMSGDYETAIAFGATHVRVGSAIFGARATRPAD